MRVKGTNDFSHYRLMCLPGLTAEDYRALGRGEVVDISKEFYDNNKHVFEVVEKEPPKKKGVKDGD